MCQRSKLHWSKVVCRPWAIVVYNVEPTLGQRRNAIWVWDVRWSSVKCNVDQSLIRVNTASQNTTYTIVWRTVSFGLPNTTTWPSSVHIFMIRLIFTIKLFPRCKITVYWNIVIILGTNIIWLDIFIFSRTCTIYIIWLINNVGSIKCCYILYGFIITCTELLFLLLDLVEVSQSLPDFCTTVLFTRWWGFFWMSISFAQYTGSRWFMC